MRISGSSGVLVLVASILIPGVSAEARPQYQTEFKNTYTKIPAAMVNCGACHGGKSGMNKKVLSDYAKAFKDSLGGTNVKGVDKIGATLKETENKEYEPGKTYGSLLLNGILPPPAK